MEIPRRVPRREAPVETKSNTNPNRSSGGNKKATDDEGESSEDSWSSREVNYEVLVWLAFFLLQVPPFRFWNMMSKTIKEVVSCR